jgi:AcrR family transcriptional regulator
MSPRRRKAEDAEVFAAMVRVMLRVGPAELTLGAIAAEAGVTAGALVQRFGSKRKLLHAHARSAAATGDIGFGAPRTARTSSPLRALRAVTAVHAKLAESPSAAVRNLAYLQNDLADPVLRRHLRRLARAARARYQQLLADAVVTGELRAGTDVRARARMVEVTLGGSYLAWTLYREGHAARHLRKDLEPHHERVEQAECDAGENSQEVAIHGCHSPSQLPFISPPASRHRWGNLRRQSPTGLRNEGSINSWMSSFISSRE